MSARYSLDLLLSKGSCRHSSPRAVLTPPRLPSPPTLCDTCAGMAHIPATWSVPAWSERLIGINPAAQNEWWIHEAAEGDVERLMSDGRGLGHHKHSVVSEAKSQETEGALYAAAAPGGGAGGTGALSQSASTHSSPRPICVHSQQTPANQRPLTAALGQSASTHSGPRPISVHSQQPSANQRRLAAALGQWASGARTGQDKYVIIEYITLPAAFLLNFRRPPGVSHGALHRLTT
jgi:hypothetical protein